MSEARTKRQILRITGMNSRHFDQLVEEKALTFIPTTRHRRKICVSALINLRLGDHYVVCQECGAWQSQITPKHLKACSKMELETYKMRHPNSSILSNIAISNRGKTEAQRIHQSETLKKRFKTLEGDVTRAQIRAASQALMQTDYRERAKEHLRTLNSTKGQKDILSRLTTARWEEGGDLRALDWHRNNKEHSNELAARARSFSVARVSKIHKKLKKAMQDSGVRGFHTEHNVAFYSIDEADPDKKIAVEVDGCYWHSCPQCGLIGPKVNKVLDKKKTSYLQNRGWTVLRFWEHDIKQRPEWCVSHIQMAIREAQDDTK